MAIDPLLGLKFDPAKVVFNLAPPEVLKACPELVNPRYGRQLLVFAKAAVDGVEYLLLGGFYVDRKAQPHTLLTDPAGAIAILSHDGCKLAGPAREEFDTPGADVDRVSLVALAKDGADRYRRAFGGSSRLRLVMRTQSVKLDAKRSEILASFFTDR